MGRKTKPKLFLGKLVKGEGKRLKKTVRRVKHKTIKASDRIEIDLPRW